MRIHLDRKLVIFVFPVCFLCLMLLQPMQVYFSRTSGFNYLLHVSFFILAIAGSLLTAYLAVRAPSDTKTALCVNAMAWLGTYVLLVILVGISEVDVPRFLGAPALAAIFVGTVFAVFTYIWFLRPAALLGTITAILVIVIVAPSESYVRTLPDAEPAEVWFGPDENFRECEYRSDINCAFVAWLMARPDLAAYAETGLPYPVFLVSAEGGGIYAAAHAYAALDIFSETCPNFRQHVFSISSVSGGSVGSAAYVADQSSYGQTTRIESCNLKSSERPQKFAEDFLSPILGSFLFGNIPNFFTRYVFDLNDSSEVLESTFTAELDFAELGSGVGEYWRPDGNSPVILINTTNLASGRVEIVSPFSTTRGLTTGSSRNDAFRPNNGSVPANLSFASGSSLSARFPFLTPSGLLAESLSFEDAGFDGTRYNVYVDGGYFDNSGIGVTRQLLSDLNSSWNHGLDYNCKDESEAFCNYILLDRGAQSSDATVSTAGNNPDWGGRDPRLETVSYLAASECISRTERPCSKEIWDAGVVPVSIYHIVIYAEPDHWDEPDLTALPRLYAQRQNQSFFDPITAVLNTRSSRAAIERNDLLFQIHGSWLQPHGLSANDKTVVLQNLDVEALGFPLSWTLGSGSMDTLLTDILDTSKCQFLVDGVTWEGGSSIHETGCTIGDIAVILTDSPLEGHDLGEF
ncbi:hypothetical protein [Litoreibacter roseus]|uniref:hypothetical protein n=1 Tax=Litoreibacter roseus TaxID=2601869 RepID=UPI00135C78D0|nr:hypothetical protein [Litoreibacter roseus]